MRFEWDAAKAASNLHKHGIRFEIALRVFADPFALSAPERASHGEVRWQTLGHVAHRLLLVAHTVRSDEEAGRTIDIIRILSARAATRHEKRRYEQETRYL